TIDRNENSLAFRQVANVCGLHVDPFASAGIDRELKRIDVVCLHICRRLVVDKRHRRDHSALSIEDYVGTTIDSRFGKRKLESSLRLPNPKQILFVLGEIAVNKLVGCPSKLLVGRLASERKVEFAV